MIGSEEIKVTYLAKLYLSQTEPRKSVKPFCSCTFSTLQEGQGRDADFLEERHDPSVIGTQLVHAMAVVGQTKLYASF